MSLRCQASASCISRNRFFSLSCHYHDDLPPYLPLIKPVQTPETSPSHTLFRTFETQTTRRQTSQESNSTEHTLNHFPST